MSISESRQNPIFEQAVRWIEAFRDGTGNREAFFAWLAESPRHVEELGFALALSEEIAALTHEQRAAIEALATDGGLQLEHGSNVVPLRDDVPVADEPAPRSSSSRRFGWAGALAACLALVIGGGWWWTNAGWQTHVSRIGELRTVQLEDGSTVYLNARSRLKVRFTAESRELQLIDGEALFKVARDAARPFRVHADAAIIQAVGTQFNVDKRPSGTVVSVLEGHVQVREQPARAPQPLSAGEEARIESSGWIEKRALTETVTVSAWHQRRLVFKDEPLEDIAEEFNRYNLTPQIRVEGEARARQFAGTFDADAPQALIQALQLDPALLIERKDDQIVIRPQATPP